MKKFLYLAAFLTCFLCRPAAAQVPNNDYNVPQPTAIPQATPDPYEADLKKNWIVTRTAIEKTTTLAGMYTAGVERVAVSTDYFDGLGRPIQSVKSEASPVMQNGDFMDVISVKNYDEFGRDQYQYLPFAADHQVNPFRNDAFQLQNTFNAAYFPGEQFFYAQAISENAANGRPLKTMAAGNSWVGSDKGISLNYMLNNALDDYAYFAHTPIPTLHNLAGGTVLDFSRYSPAELEKVITQDEDGHRSVEFRNKNGQVVLKRNYAHFGDELEVTREKSASNTLYIYDWKGQLRIVVQPKAYISLVDNEGKLQESVLNDGCFLYDYDAYGRLEAKKAPGAGWVYMVYDKRNRLVLTQDANARQLEYWSYINYDKLDHPVESGIVEAPNYSFDALKMLYLNGGSIESAGLSKHWLTLNSYSDYLNPATNDFGFDKDWADQAGYLSDPLNPYPENPSKMILDLPTYNETRLLHTPYDWNGEISRTITYYDNEQRPCQSQYISGLSGHKLDLSISHLNHFNGRLLHGLKVHLKNDRPIYIETTPTYEAHGLITSTIKKVNCFTCSGKNINSMQYDALAKLVHKNLGRDINNNVLEKQEFAYNIRGWLRGVNMNIHNHPEAWFRQELLYDFGLDKLSYNGNISGMIWQSKGDDIGRAYGFEYDGLNRLRKAAFNQINAGGEYHSYEAVWTHDVMDYSGTWKYDKNGNILSQSQKGVQWGGIVQMDQMEYNYHWESSNKLIGITDAAAYNQLGDFNDVNASDDDYDYDPNGNMIADRNKSISSIQYNFMNLPVAVNMDNQGIVEYVYDAAGKKISKLVTDFALGTNARTDYIGACVYENDALLFINDDEGKLRDLKITDQQTGYEIWAYDYFVKDHLGSVRMILTDDAQIRGYKLSMEQEVQDKESIDFQRVKETASLKPAAFDGDPLNLGVAQLGGQLTDGRTAPQIGPSKMLAVKTGDKIRLSATSYWENQPDQDYGVADLGPALTAALKEQMTLEFPDDCRLETTVGNTLMQRASGQERKPKAALNWMLFDKQQNLVAKGCGVDPVGEAGLMKLHQPNEIAIPQNGFLYVYVSNESAQTPVYFDDITIEQVLSPLREETHYYPYGLTIEAISYTNDFPSNKYHYNGKEEQCQEFASGAGLDWYDYGARMYDQQIGRWHVMDPLGEKMRRWSGYHYAFDSPMRFVDPDGMAPKDPPTPTSVQVTTIKYSLMDDDDETSDDLLGYVKIKLTKTTYSNGTIKFAGTTSKYNEEGVEIEEQLNVDEKTGTAQGFIMFGSGERVESTSVSSTATVVTPGSELGTTIEHSTSASYAGGSVKLDFLFTFDKKNNMWKEIYDPVSDPDTKSALLKLEDSNTTFNKAAGRRSVEGTPELYINKNIDQSKPVSVTPQPIVSSTVGNKQIPAYRPIERDPRASTYVAPKRYVPYNKP